MVGNWGGGGSIYKYGHPRTPLIKNTVNTDTNAVFFRIQCWSLQNGNTSVKHQKSKNRRTQKPKNLKIEKGVHGEVNIRSSRLRVLLLVLSELLPQPRAEGSPTTQSQLQGVDICYEILNAIDSMDLTT